MWAHLSANHIPSGKLIAPNSSMAQTLLNRSTQAKSHIPQGRSLLGQVRAFAWLQPLAIPVSFIIRSKRPSAGCHCTPFQAEQRAREHNQQTSEPVLAGSADGGVEADLQQQTFSGLQSCPGTLALGFSFQELPHSSTFPNSKIRASRGVRPHALFLHVLR